MTETEIDAKLIAYIIELHNGRQPWPPMKEVEEHTGIPRPAIYEALSRLQANKTITVWTRTVESGSTRPVLGKNLHQKAGPFRQRFIQPNDEPV
jgi:hypothetical protein